MCLTYWPSHVTLSPLGSVVSTGTMMPTRLQKLSDDRAHHTSLEVLEASPPQRLQPCQLLARRYDLGSAPWSGSRWHLSG